jgi:geranylgeranyl diphosphate synthase type II
MTVDLQAYIAHVKQEVDRCLDRLLPPETVEPATIHQAMRHSVFAGGKRLRPLLVLAAGESAGGDSERLIYLGSCIEMVHTYSLIHDDLPALDNDDFRRGSPTCHKVFGEAMAILAGDALLTRGFQLLSELPGAADAVRIAIIREVAAAAGTVEGMIGGQVVDLQSEGKPVSAETLEYIHRSKTGALLTACPRCGALAVGADSFQLDALTRYGRSIGLAFQIMDDILDVTSTSAVLGKTAGKDQKVQKATYPALYGLEASRRKALDLCATAVDAIEVLGMRAESLRSLARFICERSA